MFNLLYIFYYSLQREELFIPTTSGIIHFYIHMSVSTIRPTTSGYIYLSIRTESSALKKHFPQVPGILYENSAKLPQRDKPRGFSPLRDAKKRRTDKRNPAIVVAR